MRRNVDVHKLEGSGKTQQSVSEVRDFASPDNEGGLRKTNYRVPTNCMGPKTRKENPEEITGDAGEM